LGFTLPGHIGKKHALIELVEYGNFGMIYAGALHMEEEL
jgi:hypothetical protein